MSKSSIHIQKASGGAITHNSRENYSKSVVFTDEKNELWNNKKIAYEIYRSELKKRVEAYTNRTNQKLQTTAVTHLSAVVNLEQHHTLKDLESIKEELEKVFDTKVFQMAIHRDEGKIRHKISGDYFVSGTDFFYNPDDGKYYADKNKHTFSNEINIDEFDIEKNYHAHIEMLGLDSQGNAIRQKMNRYVLSNLQDFTAIALNMERGNNYQIKKSAKRLDTHEFKASKKRENEVKKIVKKAKNKIIDEANETIIKQNEKIKKTKEEKKQLKSDLEFVKNEFKTIREMLKGTGATREDFKKIDDLNKQLQNDLKNNEINIKKATEEIKNLVIDLKLDNKTKDNKIKEKDEKIEELENKINEIDEAIKNIDEMQKQINNLKNVIEKQIEIIEEKDKKIEELKNKNETLQEQINTLTIENLNLKEKNNSSANMNDYKLKYFIEVGKNEELEKMNENLKNENSFLKSTISKIIKFANEKIKDFFKFKIYNDVIFKSSDDHLNLDDWQDRCNDRYKLETEYNKQIENELLKEKDFEKVEDTNKLNLNTLEKLNKNLDEFISPKKKKEDIEQLNNYDSFLNR